MGRRLISILAMSLAATMPATGAYAQDAARIFPGFEKVFKESKKKESEAMRAIAAAEAEIAASDRLREDGERQIADADAAIQSQQLAYLTLTRGFGAAPSSREARVEAGQLEAAARAWADAEGLRDKGAKTVLAAEAQRARASERFAANQLKLASARTAIARTLQETPVGESLAPPAALTESLAPTPVEAEALPPAPKEEAALPAPAASEPTSALDRVLLGGPDGDRP